MNDFNSDYFSIGGTIGAPETRMAKELDYSKFLREVPSTSHKQGGNRFHISVANEMRDLIDVIGKERHMSRNEVVQEALRQYIAEYQAKGGKFEN